MNFPCSLLLFRLLKRSFTQTWDFGEVGVSMETRPTHRTPMGISTHSHQYAPDPTSFGARREHTATWLDDTESHPILFLHISVPSVCWEQKNNRFFQFHLFLTFLLLVYQILLWKHKWKSLWLERNCLHLYRKKVVLAESIQKATHHSRAVLALCCFILNSLFSWRSFDLNCC